MKTSTVKTFIGFLILLICSPVYSFNPAIMEDSPYKEQWKKIDSLKSAAMPKAASELVLKIQQETLRKKNPPEFIKTVLYDIMLRSEFEEDHLENSIDKVNAFIARADMPAFSVLHSIQGELYFRYFSANRFRILDRTTITSEPGTDIKTWDATAILTRAAYHYQQSVKDSDELKKTPATFFSIILDEKENSKLYRPTLFDLMAHRALDFFMNPQSSLIHPYDPFMLDQEKFFAEAPVFANEILVKPETISFNYQTLELLRQLTGFHLQDESPLALIDVEIKRLQWLRSYSVLQNRDELFMSALRNLKQKYDQTDAFPEIAHAIALELQRIGNTYHPFENPEPRLKLREAVDLLELAIERFPNVPATRNCQILLKQITTPFLQVQLNNANLPNQPFKALVSHKNVPEIHFRLINIDPALDHELRNQHRRPEELLSAYLKLEPLKTWQESLPEDGDMQTHFTEVAFTGLPNGYYVLIAGFDKYFTQRERTLPFTTFWISRISFISRRMADGTINYRVLDRETGAPIPGVKVTASTRVYNQRTRQHELQEWKTYTTARNGTFVIPASGRGEQATTFVLDFSVRNDRLITDNFFSQHRTDIDPQLRTRTFFFTDRSLYRPGQTVYFKGILIDTQGDSHTLKTNFTTSVILFDANRRKISETTVTTNEFGSFSGSFTLPNDVLTGNFMINNQFGMTSFSVEEYKLPAFEVTFEEITGNYKLGETVSIHGMAKAYAGNPIINAEVSFRVTRSARFPYPGFRSMSHFFTGPPTEILNGNLTTDQHGRFTIVFEAAADPLIAAQSMPMFIFNITASVTDINGETQRGTSAVGVGYKALLLSTDLVDDINRENLKSVTINATNLNGQAQQIQGELVISKLKQPDRVLRSRDYTRPSRFIMDQATHNAMFPMDVYDNEDDPFSWAREKQVHKSTFNTGTTSVINLSGSGSWEPGKYLIEIKTTDAFGEPVEYKNLFTLFSPRDQRLPLNQLWWATLLTPTVNPGEKAQVLIGSAVRLPVLFQVEVNGEIVSEQEINLQNRTRLIEVPVTEKHLGSFRILFNAVSNNRAFTENFVVQVPDKRKQLSIELETKRSKLEPGASEEWIVSIKDFQGKPVRAEMLAGMYDVSLDAIRPHAWSFALQGLIQRTLNWEQSHSFSMRSGTASFRIPHTEAYFREYDQLNWFGFSMHWMPVMDFRFAGTPQPAMMMREEGMMDAKATADHEVFKADDSFMEVEPVQQVLPTLMIRRDFRETAFFYPQLLSDSAGFIKLSFRVPESLTRWRLMGLAHTKSLQAGMIEEFFEASREVMVVSNAPRFLRIGDQMTLQAKVVNTTQHELNATVRLELFDAVTMEPVNERFSLLTDSQLTSIPSEGAVDLGWDIKISTDAPFAILYRITAIAGSHSDGEEIIIPVLTNKQLVTETMPMFVGANSNKTFDFRKLAESDQPGSTFEHHRLTLEFTSNPVWYSVKALPYISQANFRSASALFRKYYANRLALYIVNQNPEIERIFEIWRKTQPSALLSNLEKNQDLKSALIEETPWFNDAMSESERKRQIALLFDRNNIENELETTLQALMQLQLDNGGWAWFPGMRDNLFVTQEIIGGLGRLKAINAIEIETHSPFYRQIYKALFYLDERWMEQYRDASAEKDAKRNVFNPNVAQYLWARSYWLDMYPMYEKFQESFDYWKGQAIKDWTGQNLYVQGMVALALHRTGERDVTRQIMNSFNDRALSSEEFGMYWRDLRQGYNWYQAPIEAQSMLIEAYAAILNDMASVEKMQQWLITQKRTQAWKSDRATAEAIYAILMHGSEKLSQNQQLVVQIGDQIINPSEDPNIREEAGSGYFQISWNRNEIEARMANVSVTNSGSSMVWGGMFWQYFEQLDRITPHETPLKLKRSLMREVITPSGPVLEPVTGENPLRIGDKMVMRIELTVDRDMEFLHMKDLRAPAFEPIGQLSGYKYQGGLGYYESPRDLATHFFFQQLPRGTWVFEYPVTVSHSGDFSTGITTIQSLYAPEFSAHSEGIRIRVE